MVDDTECRGEVVKVMFLKYSTFLKSFFMHHKVMHTSYVYAHSPLLGGC